jgi:hypothetical protein
VTRARASSGIVVVVTIVVVVVDGTVVLLLVVLLDGTVVSPDPSLPLEQAATITNRAAKTALMTM